MARLMSVSLTEGAVRQRTKTVTRRLGWRFLKPGDRLTLCRKVMGRTCDEPLVRITSVEVVDVRRERLNTITTEEVEREGFLHMTPEHFAWWFSKRMRCAPDTEVTRIEWKYVDDRGETA